MTPEQLDELNFPERMEALEAEFLRFRALIKQGEVSSDMGKCAWCGNTLITDRDEPDGRHRSDCDAFTPEGNVR